ncbi:CBS domain-containing protein [Frankia sp. AiPs1]|uniref:CBS domain-containing protein n=1 Tax=Frankia sp. AiPa1 TaxID=573492 RepID=UPI00202B56B3|nr:CBS domain-containing protein [Frankia sp. AiPa1]MCL9762793.1 CBS domain-containing protein [Frankia sp. AiPa1]
MADWTVARAMVRHPKLCSATTTVGEVRRMFADDHVHAVPITAGRRLISLIDRDDVGQDVPDELLAAPLGRLSGRVVSPDAAADVILEQMIRSGRRRLAVVDDTGSLLGLLCLKRKRTGFCSDEDVLARRNDPRT